MKPGDTCTLIWNIFILIRCVVHSTNCWMKKLGWLTIQNNLLVHRQPWQNAFPSDVEWPCGCSLLTLSFGIPVTWEWGRWGKVTVLSSGAQCSLVDRHSTIMDEVAAFIFFSNGRKGSCEILVLFCQTARHHIEEDSNVTRTSHLIRCRKFPFLITYLPQETLVKLCVMLNCSMLFVFSLECIALYSFWYRSVLGWARGGYHTDMMVIARPADVCH